MANPWLTTTLCVVLISVAGCRPSDSEQSAGPGSAASGDTGAESANVADSSTDVVSAAVVRHNGYIESQSTAGGLTQTGRRNLSTESSGTSVFGDALSVSHRIKLVANEGEFDVYEVDFDFGETQFTKTLRFKDQPETLYDDGSHLVKVVPGMIPIEK